MSGTLLVTVNVHGIGPEAAITPEAQLFGRDAHGRYTYRIGLARLLDYMEQIGIKATFFWPAVEAQRMPALLERCLKTGHEVASHGNAFEDHMTLSEAHEAELIERAHELLTRMCGSAPVGFRAPTGTLSFASIPILHRLTTHLPFSMKMVAQAWLNCHSRRGLSTRRISGAGSLKTGRKPISRKSLTDCLVTQAMHVSAYIRAPIWASLAPHA